MNLQRRQKYTGSGKTVNKGNIKLDINFDISALNILSSYAISENKNIRRSHLINLRNLVEMLNVQLYINDSERMIRLDFIKKCLEAKLVKNIKNVEMLFKFISGGISEEVDPIDIHNFAQLTNSELEWVNDTVTESLKYSYMYDSIDKMIDLCTRFKSTDYRSRGAIVQEFEQLMIEMQTKFRRAKVESLNESTFTLKQGLFEEVVKDIYDQLTDPCGKLVTGMQGLNEMLSSGGFESGRIYLLLGLTGGGKSLSLLDIAYQMKKYNKNYKPKDPTKIPVIIYLTMENTVKETVDRLFEMSTQKRMIDCTYDEVISLLKEDGELYIADDNPIDIVVKYVPNRSVDTTYLYTLIEDLEDEGYEAICLIQDHVKRIRSVEHSSEPRFELGAVINEFKVVAAMKDIPVITNSHLNREAAGKIDEGAKNNKGDLIRMLGRANVGESMLMLDNCDGAYIIAQEYDQQGEKYLGVKRVKSRGRVSSRDTTYLPYLHKESPKLVEDLYEAVPTFKESLRDGPDEANLYNKGVSKYQGKLKDIDEVLDNRDIIDEMKDDSIFGSRFTSILDAQPNTELQVEDIFIKRK